jgi:peptidyl-prolyl cis-trans isomerase SurA
MNQIIKFVYIVTACFLLSIHAVNAQLDPYAIRIGNMTVSSNELSQTYRKLIQSDSVKKDKSKEFLDNFINYKLTVYAAQRMGKLVS